MKSKVVYTCITDNYDTLPKVDQCQNFDFICFLDATTYKNNREFINKNPQVYFKSIEFNGSPQDLNRYVKINPHHILAEYELSIYIDGNVKLKNDPFLAVKHVPSNEIIALYEHPDRNCAYDEIDELVRVGIARGSDATRLKNAFRQLGLPRKHGLLEANIIYRQHNHSSCKDLMDSWWQLWQCSKIKRDQPNLAFLNYLTNKNKIFSLGMSNLRSDMNPYFRYEGRIHKKSKFKRLFRRIKSEVNLYRREK